MIFTHIEALFAFKVSRLEFGLQKQRSCVTILLCSVGEGGGILIRLSSSQRRYALVPVGERHHDVQSSESEHEMEEAPVVRYFLLLVVPDLRVVPSLRIGIPPFYCGIIWLRVWENERDNTKGRKKKPLLQRKPQIAVQSAKSNTRCESSLKSTVRLSRQIASRKVHAHVRGYRLMYSNREDVKVLR